MDVRRLRPEDFKLGVEAIRRLKTPDGYPAPEETYIQRFLSRPGNVLIVAFDGDTPVGFVLAYLLDRIDRDQRMVLFYEVGVSEPHRRQGVGRSMIHVLKALCRQEDAMKMWVSTSRSNDAATRLYERTGGIPVSSVDEVMYEYTLESFV